MYFMGGGGSQQTVDPAKVGALFEKYKGERALSRSLGCLCSA
jgi:hypothetical protein